MTDSDSPPDDAPRAPAELRLLDALTLPTQVLRLEYHPLTSLGLLGPSRDPAHALRLIERFDAAPTTEAHQLADACSGLLECTRQLVAACLSSRGSTLDAPKSRLTEATSAALEAAEVFDLATRSDAP